MEDKTNLIGPLLERIEEYGKASIELYRLKAIDKSADLVSSLASRLAIFFLIIFFFLILNIGIALWVGELLGKSHYGFFIVAGFYAITCVVLYVFRNQWIKTPISNSIITQTLK